MKRVESFLIQVAAGLAVAGVLWVLATLKEAVPAWLQWASALSADVLTWLGTPRPVYTWVVLLVGAVFIRIGFEANGMLARLRELEARLNEKDQPKKSVELTEPELVLLDALATATRNMLTMDLARARTSSSEIRLKHTVKLLADKGLVGYAPSAMGNSSIYLTSEGTDYVVSNDLDKPPF
jgi:hypothetical protein